MPQICDDNAIMYRRHGKRFGKLSRRFLRGPLTPIRRASQMHIPPTPVEEAFVCESLQSAVLSSL
jgi:hypothetical protein